MAGEYKFQASDYERGLYYVYIVPGTEKHPALQAFAKFIFDFGKYDGKHGPYFICVPLTQSEPVGLLEELPQNVISVVYFARFNVPNLTSLYVARNPVHLTVTPRGKVSVVEAWGPNLKCVWEVLREYKLV